MACRSLSHPFSRVAYRHSRISLKNVPMQSSARHFSFKGAGGTVEKLTRDPKAIAVSLVGVNLGIFFHWNINFSESERQFMEKHFAFSPEEPFLRIHTAFTSIFSHADAKPLLINSGMLVLFGPQAIASLGLARFFQLYIGGGICSRIYETASVWSQKKTSSIHSPAAEPKQLQDNITLTVEDEDHSASKSLGAGGASAALALHGALAAALPHIRRSKEGGGGRVRGARAAAAGAAADPRVRGFGRGSLVAGAWRRVVGGPRGAAAAGAAAVLLGVPTLAAASSWD